MILTKDYCRDLFETFTGNGAGDAPEWVKKRREEGFAAFGKTGFPTSREEAWRFTSVRPILNHPFQLPSAPGDLTEEEVARFVASDDAVTLVFINGWFSERHSRLEGVPEGVVVGNMRSLVGSHGDLIEAHFGRYVSVDANGFAALNSAFHMDGAFVHVGSMVNVEPEIHVIYLSTPGEPPAMTHPRTLAVVDQGASARFVEMYGGVGKGIYLTNAATEVVVGDDARVEWYRVQQEADAAFHVANSHSIQGRDSWFSLITVPFGGALMRHDVRMVMNGEGGEGLLNGLYVIHDSQHVDHQTVIEHVQPHCTSHEYFNGILDDKAHAVFNGRIIVQPGAQKTDSKQTNNNLLLTETARADSQPQLEIYADDVRCTHGATLGPLDDNSLFYVESRGLDAAAARRMLTYGFSLEILDSVRSEPLREYLDQRVRARLDEGAAARV